MHGSRSSAVPGEPLRLLLRLPQSESERLPQSESERLSQSESERESRPTTARLQGSHLVRGLRPPPPAGRRPSVAPRSGASTAVARPAAASALACAPSAPSVDGSTRSPSALRGCLERLTILCILLHKSRYYSFNAMAVTRAVSHGRESMFQHECSLSHGGGADEEPNSAARLYFVDMHRRKR